MSATPCPRCGAEVSGPEGAACPACGAGDAAAPGPEAVAPASAPAPRPGGRWRVPALAGAVLVVALLVAAYFIGFGGSDPTALSQEEAEQTAALALADLTAGVHAPDGGDLRVLSGTFSFDDEDMGSGTLAMEMEWGRQETGRFLLSLATTGGFSIDFQVEAFCGGAYDVIVFGKEAYESRPAPEGTSCMDLATQDGMMDGLPLLDFDRGNASQRMEVTPHGDGTVTARFSDEEGDYTLHVDARGRATRIEVSSTEASGAFDAHYGARRLITPPETTGRMPSGVGGECWFSDGACTYDARDGDDAPLSDFEVRLYPAGATPEDDPGAAPAAAFPLDGGAQSAGGFSFTPIEDGDGLFGDGDSFQVTAPGDGYQVVVWDLWADRSVDDHPAPAPALLWTALAFAAVALARRGSFQRPHDKS